jgi:aspartate-semialdehyde dehydrogenase
MIINTASIIRTAKRVPLRLPNINKNNAIKAAKVAIGIKL